ncbi:hypothetical protein A4224_06245 [Streptococcus oralis]|nr:hypothetical protein A4224_06245 [Streptococcus oralis]
MTNLKEELTNSLSDLIVFLSSYKEKNNVNNFIGILEEMHFILQSIGNSQIPAETMIHLQKRYKSLFFPRDGLSDFYIMDSDAAYMKRKNEQFSLLIKRIDSLLED